MSHSNKIFLLILASALGLLVALPSEAAWLGGPTAAVKSASASILETVKKKRSWSRRDNPNPTLKQEDEYQGSPLGKRDCGEGYVALDKPNKYGAYCERAATTCPKDYVGTPPKCEYCPNGKTEEGICFF
jgi:hypothetical protein